MTFFASLYKVGDNVVLTRHVDKEGWGHVGMLIVGDAVGFWPKSHLQLYILILQKLFYSPTRCRSLLDKYLTWHFLFTHLFYLPRAWGQVMLYHMLE